MRTIIGVLFVAIVLLIVGCATVSIQTDHDPNADFSKYKTWDFPANVDDFAVNVIRNNPIVHREMLRILEETMVTKGYVKTVGKPDMFVVYQVTTDQKQSVTTYSGGYYGWGYYGWGGGYTTTVRVDEYTQGTLIIDLVDAEEEELLWRGWATGTLEDRPEIKRLEDVVKGMLAQFPPK